MEDLRTFHEARDGVGLSLDAAAANISDASRNLERLATLVEDRIEVDHARGALEIVGHAIRDLIDSTGCIMPDGTRSR